MPSNARKKLVRSASTSSSSHGCSRWTVRGSSAIAMAFVADLWTSTESFSPATANLRAPQHMYESRISSWWEGRSNPTSRTYSARRRDSRPFVRSVSRCWLQAGKQPIPTLRASVSASTSAAMASETYQVLDDDSKRGGRGCKGGKDVGHGTENGRQVMMADRCRTRAEIMLRSGDVVECWHAKTLVLGNYEGLGPEGRSLRVRKMTGEALTIDPGQIVGVWSADTVRGPVPSSTAEWMELQAQARALLQGMPARALDLGALWKAAASTGRKKMVVTTAHAAEYLFSESQAQVGLKKRKPFQFNRYVEATPIPAPNSCPHGPLRRKVLQAALVPRAGSGDAGITISSYR